MRDCSISCFRMAVHSAWVQTELAASGDQTRRVRSDSLRPRLISATKLAPDSMSSSQSQGVKPLASRVIASFLTKSPSFVLWERKTFMARPLLTLSPTKGDKSGARKFGTAKGSKGLAMSQ